MAQGQTRSAIVAGGASGMGRALVEELAGLGVRDHARFPAIVNETFERTGRLDSLFNDAGIGAGTMSSTRACGSSPTV